MLVAEQKRFLKDEIWLLSFIAALQRNKIYNDSATEPKRKAFRKELKDYISSNILPLYENGVNEKQHQAFLVSIVDNSKYHKSILLHGQLNIGTAQKLLNLVLKYYWCLGWIEEPPHFPIDRIIQKHIPYKSRNKWTEMTSLKEYNSIIVAARKELKEGETLAQWELKNYSRK